MVRRNGLYLTEEILLSDVGIIRDIYETLPKSDLLNISVNPYTGMCFVKYRNEEKAVLVIDRIMQQTNYFNNLPGRFRDHAQGVGQLYMAGLINGK